MKLSNKNKEIIKKHYAGMPRHNNKPNNKVSTMLLIPLVEGA